jgi:hypothetical protein
MAEINIERKRRPVWPWLLVLLLIGGIIWALAELGGRKGFGSEGDSEGGKSRKEQVDTTDYSKNDESDNSKTNNK